MSFLAQLFDRSLATVKIHHPQQPDIFRQLLETPSAHDPGDIVKRLKAADEKVRLYLNHPQLINNASLSSLDSLHEERNKDIYRLWREKPGPLVFNIHFAAATAYLANLSALLLNVTRTEAIDPWQRCKATHDAMDALFQQAAWHHLAYEPLPEFWFRQRAELAKRFQQQLIRHHELTSAFRSQFDQTLIASLLLEKAGTNALNQSDIQNITALISQLARALLPLPATSGAAIYLCPSSGHTECAASAEDIPADSLIIFPVDHISQALNKGLGTTNHRLLSHLNQQLTEDIQHERARSSARQSSTQTLNVNPGFEAAIKSMTGKAQPSSLRAITLEASTDGCSMLLTHAGNIRLRPGQLLAIQMAGSLPGKLATIRWLKANTQSNAVRLGVQYLPEQASIIHIRRSTPFRNGANTREAILLQGEESSIQRELLLPKGELITQGEMYELLPEHTNWQASHVLDHGTDFEQVRICPG